MWLLCHVDADASVCHSGGGATAPFVQQRLVDLITEASGSKVAPEVLNTIEPAEVCATGAAVHGAAIEATVSRGSKEEDQFVAELQSQEAATRAFPVSVKIAGHEFVSKGAEYPLVAEEAFMHVPWTRSQ